MNNIIKEETQGQRIRTARIRKGYTQEQLAEVMCIPKSTVSAYENDKVDIKGSVLVELSRYLDTTLNYLLAISKKEEDPFDKEIINLIQQIKDEKTKKIILAQITAIVNM